jgi:6-phospho-beta-glucosidase
MLPPRYARSGAQLHTAGRPATVAAGGRAVKLALIGGGGFRVPLVYGALLRRRATVPIDEVVLHDVDAQRLERIGLVLEGQAAEHGERLPFRATTDLDDAVEGAAFVFSAIRVGRLEGRAIDEAVPLGHGVLGQETVGPGGICFALRTIPVMVEVAEAVARRAPGAWLVNFTNPAGMVTEATQQVLGDRAVGVCDTPSGLCRRVAAALGRPPEELWFDWVGLNHLGWLRGVHDGTGDVLPGLLADDAALARIEEARLFGAEWLRSIGMIPSEYLYYFYYGTDTVEAIRRSPQPRGAYLREQQAAFYAGGGEGPADALRAWRAARDERDRTYMAEARSAAGVDGAHAEGGEGYEGEAMAVVAAIAGDTREVRILNVANRSALPFLDERAVVEVPCVVGRAGPRPVAAGDIPDHARALVESVKAVERATIEAAVTGSSALAVKALALHPLVPSVATARKIFAGYRAQLPDLEERFAWA